MTGEMFNSFCESILATNFGGPTITFLGRDILMLITGYLIHLVIESFIEIIKESRK